MTWLVPAIILLVVVVILRASWGGRRSALDAQSDREAGARAEAALAEHRREQAAVRDSENRTDPRA